MTGCLNFEDRIEDGFFDLRGLSPAAWALCADPSQRGRMPPLESLRALNPGPSDPSLGLEFEAALFHRQRDPQLRELEDAAVEEGFMATEVKALARRIGVLVAQHLGWVDSPLLQICVNSFTESKVFLCCFVPFAFFVLSLVFSPVQFFNFATTDENFFSRRFP